MSTHGWFNLGHMGEVAQESCYWSEKMPILEA
jgi:hypothetical protein